MNPGLLYHQLKKFRVIPADKEYDIIANSFFDLIAIKINKLVIIGKNRFSMSVSILPIDERVKYANEKEPINPPSNPQIGSFM